MRKMESSEIRVLLKAAASGQLDRSDLGEVRNESEAVFAEAVRQEDGSAVWSLHHYPFTSEDKWKMYLSDMEEGGKPQRVIDLTPEERRTIIKACAIGQIEERTLPRIYPLIALPQIVAVVYVGYGEGDQWKEAPSFDKGLFTQAVPKGYGAKGGFPDISKVIHEIYITADRHKAKLPHHGQEHQEEDAGEILHLMDYSTGEMAEVPRYLTDGYTFMGFLYVGAIDEIAP